MCYHIKISKSKNEIESKLDLSISNLSNFQKAEALNGFDKPLTPVISNKNLTEIEMFKWGFDDDVLRLNTRSETMNSKYPFKDFILNRCLIIVDGFYEWKHIGKSKNEKYELGFNNEIFTLAAIYKLNKKNIYEYSILTTCAKGIMYDIHNSKPDDRRMPIAFKSHEKMYNYLNSGTLDYDSDFSYSNLSSQLSLF